MNTLHPAVVNFAFEPGSVELRAMPEPEIGPDDVLLEVAYVGVCGSDLHRWLGTPSVRVNYPVILGHEFAGTIAAAGAAVTAFRPGDRVVSETAAVINPASPLTRRGLYNLDPGRKGFGYGVHGAMTRFVRVPQRCLHRVPEELPLRIAALAEPCCVAVNAVVNHSRISPGDRVVILGPGTIGILCAAVARLQGAEVTLAGLAADATRLDIAQRAYGVSIFAGDPRELKAGGDGYGPDVVIDAAGVSASLRTALDLVRPGGWITKVGWGPQPLNFSLDPLVQKAVTLQGSYSHNWPVWDRVLRLLAGRNLVIDGLIGGTWPLAGWHAAFSAMHEGRVVKSVLEVAPAPE
jgi:alcohol dehydrogenase/L-iditol 2-dehydrogenase